MESLGRHNIHRPSQELAKIHHQSRMIEETPSRLEIHEEVNIAVGTFFIANHGTEETDIVRPIAGGDLKNLVAASRQNVS
jgi:hypothetical protein